MPGAEDMRCATDRAGPAGATRVAFAGTFANARLPILPVPPAFQQNKETFGIV